MPNTTLGQRLAAALLASEIGQPADLARAAKTSTATISNWMKDAVTPENVKAIQLFQIADAVGADPRYLLFGTHSKPRVNDSHGSYSAQQSSESQPVKQEEWTLAFQLVAEALDDRGLTLPPAKRAEVTLLAYELLQEGLQRAKVLRFVQAAAA